MTVGREASAGIGPWKDGPVPLRGRATELELIEEAIGAAQRGHGAIVVVEGRAGFGKTRLIDEACRIAQLAGLRTGLGRADVDDASAQMSPWMQACFGGDRPLLGPVAPAVLRTGSDRYWVLLELQELLERAALEQPLLVCLDDMHWADSGTTAGLRSLPIRLAGTPIVWIVAYRTGQASASLLRAVEELGDAKATRIALDALSDEAADQIMSDVIRATPDDALRELTETAHGVPFFLIELLLGLVDEGLLDIRNGSAKLIGRTLPSRVRDSMRERLARVGPQARQAAIAGSVLGRSFRLEDLAAMLDTTPAGLLEALEELTRADILSDSEERLRFRHDIIRQAVLDSIQAAARRALDRQAAGILLEAGGLPMEIAARLAADAEPGDEVALAVLHGAAQALGATDPDTASAFARRALELTAPEDPRRAQFVAETAVLMHAAGHGARAMTFANEALGQVLPPEAEAQVRLSIAQMYSLPADLRIETGRVALALDDVSTLLRTRHLAVLVLSLVAASRPADAKAAAAEAQTAVDAEGDDIARMNLEFGRLALDEATSDYPAMMSRIKTIHRLGAETGISTQVQAAEWFRATLMAALGRFDEALAVVRSGLAVARRDGQAWIAPRWNIWQGWIVLQRGQLSEAGAALEGAFASGDIEVATAIPDAAGLLALGQVALHTGDERLTARCAQIARASLEAGGFDDSRRHVAWLLALQAMARGEATAARSELSSAGLDLADAALPVLARPVGFELQLVRLGLAAGDRLLADQGVREASLRARHNPECADIVAVSEHARGLRDGDIEALKAAVDGFDLDRPLLLASALEDLGDAYVKGADGAEGIDALERALEILISTGATRDARRIRGKLRGLGVQRRSISAERPLLGWEALTDSELEVAKLVATGLTNAQTAERLFVSPHTVGTHLRHIFAKLDVNSRVEMTRIALHQSNGTV